LTMGTNISILRRHHLGHLSLALLILARVPTTYSLVFDRGTCLTTLATNYTEDTSIYLFGSNYTHPIVSYDTCRRICGNETGWYADSVPRLNTWLLPVLILLANLEYATVSGDSSLWERAKLCVVVGTASLAHVLGDPVDYTLSLLLHVEAWNRCLALAREIRPKRNQTDEAYEVEIRSLAIILAAFDWILEYHENVAEADGLFFTLTEELRAIDKMRSGAVEFETKEAREREISNAIAFETRIAQNLAAVRSRSLIPACVAILLYVWQVTGAFVPIIGASSSPSGGRVAYAILLSWIIFVVLLNNTVGNISSSDAFAENLREYLLKRGHPSFALETFDRLVRTSFHSTYFRRDMHHSRVHKNGRNPDLLRVISSLPILMALGYSLAVTSVPPTYFSIRHTLFFGIGLVYLFLSPLLTSLLRHTLGVLAVRLKNSATAITVTVLLILASCGRFFNNCQGWMPWFPLNMGVSLFPEYEFNVNDNVLYPIFVSLCIAMQVGLWILMWALCGRGLDVMKYTKVKGVKGEGSSTTPSDGEILGECDSAPKKLETEGSGYEKSVGVLSEGRRTRLEAHQEVPQNQDSYVIESEILLNDEINL
jgi:hypothetical protein